jgi:glycoprotein 2-beta-D-xylosyltransferase
MQNVLNSMKYPKKINEKIDMECAETWSGTTMFITRYEYVNLYHTMTDWWNAYFTMPPEDTNIRVVFLDGHAKGNLDPVWEQMFGKFTYVQHLPKGGVCFEKAVFIPAGYDSTLFPFVGIRLHCPRQKLADEFSNHVLKSFNLQNLQRIPGKVVIIDRKPYISHPRSKPENAQRILSNLDKLRHRLLKVKGVTSVELLRLETMSFGEQLSAIREAHILIGNHGAGLSHLLFMDRKSDVFEFTIDYLDFFSYLCEWKGVQHTPIPITEDGMLSLSEIERTASFVESRLE